MNSVATTLRLPKHFGHNWDALEESLVDLDWAGSDGVVIYYDHIDGLLTAHADQFETLVEICRDAVASWKRTGPPSSSSSPASRRPRASPSSPPRSNYSEPAMRVALPPAAAVLTVNVRSVAKRKR